MGGFAVDDGFEFDSLCNEVKTVVLVGRTGNGKSATGNSIIGRKVFDSRPSSAGVTMTCNLQRTLLEDGQILNVIDTPGLFDSSVKQEFIGKEIAKCINMAKDGIHAVLLVLSTRTLFSEEEAKAVETLMQFFGGKFGDYMIVVFTGGDALGDMSLDDYLGPNRPDYLERTLKLCGNRCVVFDNMTDNESKKSAQVKELLSFVNDVVDSNGGVPYTNELFAELKMEELKLHDQIGSSEMSELEKHVSNSYEVQLKGFVEMIELRLRDSIQRLEEQLAKEQAARVEAEKTAQEALSKSNARILELMESLDRSSRETKCLQKTHKELEEKMQNDIARMEDDLRHKHGFLGFEQ